MSETCILTAPITGWTTTAADGSHFLPPCSGRIFAHWSPEEHPLSASSLNRNRTDYLRHHYHSIFFVSNVNLSANCHFLSANFSYHPINITFFIFISLFNKYSFVFCFVIPYYQRNSNQPPKTDTFHPKICIFLILSLWYYASSDIKQRSANLLPQL